eukprot:1147731-Pelagomonas_calceolata.AAC.3
MVGVMDLQQHLSLRKSCSVLNKENAQGRGEEDFENKGLREANPASECRLLNSPRLSMLEEC